MLLTRDDAIDLVQNLGGRVVAFNTGRKEYLVTLPEQIDTHTQNVILDLVMPLITDTQFEDREFAHVLSREFLAIEIAKRMDGVRVVPEYKGADSHVLIFDNKGMKEEFSKALFAVSDWYEVKQSFLYEEYDRWEFDIDGIVAYGYDGDYEVCADCGCAIDKTPTGYNWQLPAIYLETDGIPEYFCTDCVVDDKNLQFWHILDCLNNPKKAITDDVCDLEEFGFHYIDVRFETGFHKGQNDSPEKVFGVLNEAGWDVVMQVTTGQFDANWWVWVKPQALDMAKFDGAEPNLKEYFVLVDTVKELDRYTELVEEVDEYVESHNNWWSREFKLDYDIAEEMEKALSQQSSTKHVQVTDGELTQYGVDHKVFTLKEDDNGPKGD